LQSGKAVNSYMSVDANILLNILNTTWAKTILWLVALRISTHRHTRFL